MKWLLLLAVTIGSGPAPEFSSLYTFMDKAKCQSLEDEYPEGDTPQRCEGEAGFSIYTYYNLYGHGIRSVEGADNWSVSLTANGCTDSQDYGNAIEWRTANGKPFAVIQRVMCLRMAEETDPETGIVFEIFEVESEFLLVKGLPGYTHIDHTINVKETPKANEVARNAADAGYTKK